MSESASMDAATVRPAQERPPQGFARRVYDQWRRGAHAIGVVQTRFLMFLLYLVAVVPTGVLMKMGSDPLHLRKPAETNCQPARQDERNLENARRQF